jgi:hypothetical protein
MKLGFKPDGFDVQESFAFSATAMNAEEDASFNACMKAILKR